MFRLPNEQISLNIAGRNIIMRRIASIIEYMRDRTSWFVSIGDAMEVENSRVLTRFGKSAIDNNLQS